MNRKERKDTALASTTEDAAIAQNFREAINWMVTIMNRGKAQGIEMDFSIVPSADGKGFTATYRCMKVLGRQ